MSIDDDTLDDAVMHPSSPLWNEDGLLAWCALRRLAPVVLTRALLVRDEIQGAKESYPYHFGTSF